MAQKPGPNRSQELEEISKSIQMTMEILTSVKDTLLKALDDTPVCPTYNQESPPLDWGSTQTPTAWGRLTQNSWKQKPKVRKEKILAVGARLLRDIAGRFAVSDVISRAIVLPNVRLIGQKFSRERSKLRLTKSQSRKRLIVIENH